MAKDKGSRIKPTVVGRRKINQKSASEKTLARKSGHAPPPITSTKEHENIRVKATVIGRRKTIQKSAPEKTIASKSGHAASSIDSAKEHAKNSIKTEDKPERKKIDPEFEHDKTLSKNPEATITSSVIEKSKSERNEVDKSQKERFDFKNSKEFIIDAQNVCYSYTRPGEKYSFEALLSLLVEVNKRGGTFKCLFDANALYVIEEHCKTNLPWFKKLKRNFPNNFQLVPSGSPADDFILNAAEKHGNLVISNDTYEKYKDEYPWSRKRGGRIIKGMIDSDEISIPKLGIHCPIRNDVETMVEELIKNFNRS